MSLVPSGWAAGAGGGSPDLNFLEMMEAAGGPTSINFALDAGSIDSWPGFGPLWYDLTANNNDFYRGTSASPNTATPFFVGTAGDLSSGEYWLFDGSDMFSEAAAHTFAESWHKANGAFTLCGVLFVPAGVTSTDFVFSNMSNFTTQHGVYLTTRYDTDNSLQMVGTKAAGTTTFAYSSGIANASAVLIEDSWNYFAVSVSDITDTRYWQINSYAGGGSVPSFASPSSASSSSPYAIGRSADGFFPLTTAHRLACIGGVSRAWSAAELDALYDLVKVRFPTIP